MKIRNISCLYIFTVNKYIWYKIVFYWFVVLSLLKAIYRWILHILEQMYILWVNFSIIIATTISFKTQIRFYGMFLFGPKYVGYSLIFWRSIYIIFFIIKSSKLFDLIKIVKKTGEPNTVGEIIVLRLLRVTYFSSCKRCIKKRDPLKNFFNFFKVKRILYFG